MVDEGVLTTEEIARVAGVARGTVSGWRRRHAEFPAPVSGTGRGPVFDQAEVEAWLAGAGLVRTRPERLTLAGGEPCRRAVLPWAGSSPPSRWPSRHTPTGRPREHDLPASLARAAERSVDEAGAVAVLGDLIDRYSVASGRYVTPARIAEFMVSLAAIGEGATVLDPASGTGELLAAALARGAGRVLAQDASAEAVALAKARLLPGESQRAEVVVGESLRADAFAGVEADAVLCRPLLPADGSEAGAGLGAARARAPEAGRPGRLAAAVVGRHQPGRLAGPCGPPARGIAARGHRTPALRWLAIRRPAALVAPATARRRGRSGPAGAVRRTQA